MAQPVLKQVMVRMVRKTREEAEKNKERILDAAEDVFCRRGVSGATMADIADCAGVSRGAVYGHYKSKAHVFLAMCDRTNKLFNELLSGIIDESIKEGDPLGFLRLATLSYMRIVLLNDRFRRFAELPYFKCEYVGGNAELLEYAHKLQKQRMDRLVALIEKAKIKGQLSKDLDVGLASQFFTCALDGMLRKDLFNPKIHDIRDHIDDMVTAILDCMKYSEALRHK